jgi:FtsH-binding integral membrane protein
VEDMKKYLVMAIVVLVVMAVVNRVPQLKAITG